MKFEGEGVASFDDKARHVWLARVLTDPGTVRVTIKGVNRRTELVVFGYESDWYFILTR